MSNNQKRLRIFAGPNGSGKSTLTTIIKDMVNLGVYINADDILNAIQTVKRIDFADYGIITTKEAYIHALTITTYDIDNKWENWSFGANAILFTDVDKLGPYFAAFLADFIRNILLEQSQKFSFETVMSDIKKLEFIEKAKEKGFKVYLYFISLQDPELNVYRVRTRVAQGGHNVDEKKIVERYVRTMDFLFDAIKLADCAYIFDNSGSEIKLIAQKEKGTLTAMVDYAPAWYKRYVLDKIV